MARIIRMKGMRAVTAPTRADGSESPTAVALRQLRGSMQTCDELRLALALVTHGYHLSVEFVDEEALNERCASLAPWLLPTLARTRSRGNGGAHLALIIGDPARQTVYLSRRVLRLLDMQAQRPTAFALTLASVDTLALHQADALGPVARLTRYQADALVAVAARMAADRSGGYTYVMTMPRAVTEAAAQASSGQPCRVLALPALPGPDHHVDAGLPSPPSS